MRLRTQARRRRIRAGLAVVFLGALSAYGLHHGARYWPDLQERLWSGDGYFALKEVQMLGPFQAVTRAEIEFRAGVERGQNLLALDLGRIKRDLEAIPYVESAAVERILPHLLRLRLTERTPVARLELFGFDTGRPDAPTLYYLDRDGAVMPASFNVVVPGDPFAQLDLPTITGANPMEIRPGDRAVDPAVLWALDLVAAYDRVPISRVLRLKRIDVEPRSTLRATLGNGTRVVFGPTPFDLARLERQLLRLGLLHDLGREHRQRLLEVDLSVENNCPSLWTPVTDASDGVPASNLRQSFPSHDV